MKLDKVDNSLLNKIDDKIWNESSDFDNHWKLRYMDDFYLLAYEFEHDYDGEGEYGFNRDLTEREEKFWREKFNDVFKQLGIDKEADGEIRYVDYCYYNGCDCPDFFTTQFDDTIEMYKKLKEK